MAKKVILGTDIARDAFKVKVNENFTELYNKDVALGEQINNLDAHLSDLITDADGAHGLKIEEGNWTPVLKGETVAGVNTYSMQEGKYFKIGKLVYVKFAITLTTKDINMAGIVQISGLPFAINAISAYAGGSLTFAQDVTLGAGYTQISAYLPNKNLTYANIVQMGSDKLYSFLAATGIKNTSILRGAFSYISN